MKLNHILDFRGNPEDYDGWAKQGCTGWDFKSVFPYFLKSEGYQDTPLDGLLNDPTERRYHNTTGPLAVSQSQFSPIALQKCNTILQSLDEIGIKTQQDYNGPDQLGISIPFNTQYLAPSIRSSSAVAFLAPATNRKNLFVLKNTFVKKVLIGKDKIADGVKVVTNGEQKTKVFFAKKEVIISAGTINTP